MIEKQWILKTCSYYQLIRNSIILFESCMQYQSCPLYPLFGSMGKTSSHPLQITINPTSLNGILHFNMQKNPKRSNAREKVITWHNLILVFILLCQTNDNLLSNCMLNILTTCSSIISILCTYLNLALTKNQNFIPYQQGLAFMYHQMGKYFTQYLIIIFLTNVLWFTFQNCSHRSL
jgi:hypothetical protein